MGDQQMESKLQTLIEGNSETNRTKWAMEWKKQGRKVIGVMSSYVPEEVISATGMLPWRITGVWRENINDARAYRSESSCSYCNHVLESFLSGELDFLDGVVIPDTDQDLLRLWDVILSLKKVPYCYAMHIPVVDSEVNYRYLADEIRKFALSLEEFGGNEITETALLSAMGTYNKMRNLLGQVYELRKKTVPPLSGAEVLGITTTAQVMPKDEFNSELEMLLPYLEQRETNLPKLSPRVLIISEMLDNPEYLNLVEEGCLVSMDDLDTGSRYFIQEVEMNHGDPAYALAKRHISRHGAPRMVSWEKQFDQVIEWVKEYNIDGVLGLPLTWCYPQRFRWPLLSRKLDEFGIPNMAVEREYHFANAGQLKTRVGAFLEILKRKSE